MNLRKISLRYMGWCPGVKAASQFLPDRDIPPTQMAIMLALASTATLSGYYLANTILTTAGIPSQRDIPIKYDNPIIAARGNEAYISAIVRLGGPLDYGTRYMLWLAKMSLEGGLSDVTILVDTPLIIDYDLLVTREGRFYIAYMLSTIPGRPKQIRILESGDGVDWAKSELTFTDDLSRHALAETKDGSPFLFIYAVDRQYSFSTYSGGQWAPFEEYPHDFLLTRFSATTDGEGNVVIAGKNETERSSYMFTSMNDRGEWSKPARLNLGDLIHIEYRELDILYSPKRNGFYITIASRVREHSMVYIKFSRDLVNWEDAASFRQGSDSSMTELLNGTVIAAFNDHDAQEIHHTRSQDGISWTAPKKVEQAPVNRILEEVVSSRRRLVSSISGTLIGIYTFIALIKKPSKPFFKQH